MEQPVFYSQLLEFVIQIGTVSKVQIQDQPLLRGARIFSLEIYDDNDITVSPLGNNVIPLDALQQMYFVGYTSDPTQKFVPNSGTNNQAGLWIDTVPCVDMHKIQNDAGDPFSRDGFNLCGNQTIFWEKSYFVLANGFNFTTVTSILMRVNFLLFPGNTTN